MAAVAKKSMQTNVEIIGLLPEHWSAVREIYLQGIATRSSTFQTDAPSWTEWDRGHLPTLRYVLIKDGHLAPGQHFLRCPDGVFMQE